MIPRLVRSAQDLVTSRDATRQGFLEQALKKTEVANIYIAQAHHLCDRLSDAESPQAAVDLEDIQDELTAAAGFSDKAANYFPSPDLKSALTTVLEKIHEEDGENWRDEVLYRFLLTRGDSLGGSMRNITGAAAHTKFAQAVIDILEERDISPTVIYSPRSPDKIQRIDWNARILLFDRTPGFIRKNIDAILLNNSGPYDRDSQRLLQRQDYIACGEIKGGIDPAGADEHWKTAGSALERIRERFPEGPPDLFFAGAAIESSMAEEIFTQLQSDRLAYAANLTVSEQLSDLAAWLTSL